MNFIFVTGFYLGSRRHGHSVTLVCMGHHEIARDSVQFLRVTDLYCPARGMEERMIGGAERVLHNEIQFYVVNEAYQ